MKRRVEQEPAFVLHSYAYKETSLVVEVLSRRHGRLGLLARGARRPLSAMRGVLLAFHPLRLTWTASAELGTLLSAEWAGGQRSLAGTALMCGFYLNELLLRLLPREDAHDALFARYADALRDLGAAGESAPVLRSFERALLKEMGYAMALERDSVSGTPIDPQKSYRYDPERGPIEANGAAADSLVSGRTLLDMARDDYADPLTQQQAKALMRALLDHRLEHQPLKSRRIFRDLLAL